MKEKNRSIAKNSGSYIDDFETTSPPQRKWKKEEKKKKEKNEEDMDSANVL